MNKLIEQLEREHRLPLEGYEALLTHATQETAAQLAQRALAVKQTHFGNEIYIRGLIEISNFCKNDCYYCGIRRSNPNCLRYRLTPEEILACCAEGYALGFRTFVLQGGEDGYFSDQVLTSLLRQIKAHWPDCAVTLSLGERRRESYQALKEAGADRYLLRHENCDEAHYATLHPREMSWQNRMDCLGSLRELGYQVGCGFMVGTPGQSVQMLARELKFIEKFRPEMCGIGPFLPHSDTPMGQNAPGSATLTCLLLSCIRLIHPKILLPATTALGTLLPDGRERGILAGANVVMPNLSPAAVRKNYMLYDNKLSDGAESAQSLDALKRRLEAIGCTVAVSRGDAPK